MSQPSSHTTTDFGYERVRREDKARRVRGVFDSVADNYDLMNDLMSGGAHRLWKRFTLSITGLRPGQVALDVAGGTGDIALGLARQVGTQGLVVLTDINAAMLAHGRDRLIDAGRGAELEAERTKGVLREMDEAREASQTPEARAAAKRARDLALSAIGRTAA